MAVCEPKRAEAVVRGALVIRCELSWWGHLWLVCALDSMSVRVAKPDKMKKSTLVRVLFSGLVHTACGILPGEEIYELFVQTGTARRDKTPSGKQVREFAPPC